MNVHLKCTCKSKGMEQSNYKYFNQIFLFPLLTKVSQQLEDILCGYNVQSYNCTESQLHK